MSKQHLKVAVLISGTGSNLKTLINAVSHQGLELDITRVISNRAAAPGIAHAEDAGISVSVISHADYPDRQAHDAAVLQVLRSAQVELVILAGYMRILGEEFTRAYSGRMINLHPSLLPKYKGLDTYNRVLQSGDEETGARVGAATLLRDESCNALVRSGRAVVGRYRRNPGRDRSAGRCVGP